MYVETGLFNTAVDIQLGHQISRCKICPARELNFCGGVPYSELERLAPVPTVHRVPAGRDIIREGEPADAVIVITSGTTKRFKLMPDGRRQIIGFLFAGDILGGSLDATYVNSAQAVSEVMLCRFPLPQLKELVEEFPTMYRQLLLNTFAELTIAQDQIVVLGRKTPCEKVAWFLLWLSARVASPNLTNRIRLPMTRADIADYLGLREETVSRTFTRLKNRGYIAVSKSKEIVIVDRGQIEALANGSGHVWASGGRLE